MNNLNFNDKISFKFDFWKEARKSWSLRSILVLLGIAIISLLIKSYYEYSTAFERSDVIIYFWSDHSELLLGLSMLGCTLYWERDRKFARKWTYCAGVFNDIYIKQQNIFNHKLSLSYKRAIFAADLLDCGLWDHKSFYREFNQTLQNGITYCTTNEIGITIPSSFAINSGMASFTTARLIISKYIQGLEGMLQDEVLKDQDATESASSF